MTMTMQGSELRALRKTAGLTQAEMGQLLHLSGPYVGEMERDEKAIEPRTAALIDLHLRHRIDVSRSSTIGKWFVTVTGPGSSGIGRVHDVRDGFDQREAAIGLAERIKREEFPLARILEMPEPDA